MTTVVLEYDKEGLITTVRVDGYKEVNVANQEDFRVNGKLVRSVLTDQVMEDSYGEA